jgi:hypothetical protein
MMKRIATLLALLALSAAPAFATVLLSDSFTYPNGDLGVNAPWSVYSGTPPTDIQVNAGRVIINHSNAPDDHALFPVQSTSTKTYACFDVIVPNPGGAPKPVYFFELKDNAASNLVSRVYVLTSGAGFVFGISHSTTSATAGVTPWSSTLTYGTKYNVAVNYDPVNMSSTLWVNPASELSPSVTDVNAAIAALAVQGVGFRQSSTASTFPAAQNALYAGTVNATVSVDNLGVGTTFVDACQQYQSTPAQRSTWGQVKSMYR